MFFTKKIFYVFLKILKFSLGKPVSSLNQSKKKMNEQKVRKHRKYFLRFPKVKTQPLKKDHHFIDIFYYKKFLKAKLYISAHFPKLYYD